eukprot:CAMPEP_0206483152 /NCGR_PEP_ID=MMETSP0324_2-20121206/39262_1 /ASSEMBLY_ACC=CAM_ASM_000836 /TAXON_ID=2866 /ORGANISM="Crypthecodinium cohnii, Strain Seligo" /LENGTH=392 /DNA_ID=CAMNT_0053961161 /DNA_START=113 /DNA_END=1291 /DNA_ORIENTATION=+
MATARPVVSVYDAEDPTKKTGSTTMPNVLVAPLRPDLVRFVHTNIAKNKRMAHSVYIEAGHETAAQSWHTGRAVARIPRAPGGGTHRAGQGAFGNMCRGGHMFNPTRTWRRWHRRVNSTMKRHAVASALAASSLVPLVMARGHRVSKVPEVPMVVSDSLEKVAKTKQAVTLLKGLGCSDELNKVKDSKTVRAGKGKMRNRRYKMRRGVLVVYKEDSGLVKAMRNIPGVETCSVDRLNLLSLAPGGNFGRFIVWTESAFKTLNEIYGSHKSGAPLKKGYTLPRAVMENADLERLINSNEIQSVLKPKLDAPKTFQARLNPFSHKKRMLELNPFAEEHSKASTDSAAIKSAKAERVKAGKEYNKKFKKGDDTFYKKLMKAFEPKVVSPVEEADE